jgi:N-methylhydantoinase A
MRVAFDVGGTFTDVVFSDEDGNIHASKLLSLLPSLGKDVASLVARPEGSRTDYIHATTVASNAVLEGKLSPTALITTRGFRDVLEMRGQRAPRSRSRDWQRPPPVVGRPLRFEVRERVLADGSIDERLNMADVAAAAAKIAAAGVKSVAICLINGYLWPDHERTIERFIRERYSEIAVSVSSRGFAQIGEYERSSTTVINAALMPILGDYFNRLEDQLATDRGRLLVMQSTGGLMNSAVARDRPVHMIESGPAAGVLAATRVARENGLDQILTFDMGGTTAKVAVLDHGRPLEKSQTEIGGGANLSTRMSGGVGHVVKVPALDIIEVGAGGGSIARVDNGILRVGPQGAGADPGPICYRRGGTVPTVTDANVVLGYINPRVIAGGTLEIDRDASWEAITKDIGRLLGLDTQEAAYGIVRLADATMTRAIRAATVERGLDPRTMTMIAYGGAGPLHAARLAETAGIERIYVPRLPGLFSALGLLFADYRCHAVRDLMRPLATLTVNELRQVVRELETDVLRDLSSEGIERASVDVRRELDVQYQDQYGHLQVSLTELPRDDAALRVLLAEDFHAAHVAAYGYGRSDPIFVLAARVVGSSATGKEGEVHVGSAANSGKHAAPVERHAYFGPGRGSVATPVVSRWDIFRNGPEGRKGPLIIEEPDTTVLVPPGWCISGDRQSNLIMTRCN